MKQFIGDNFLDFKIVDLRTVICWVEELQLILYDIHAEGMSLSKFFQVIVVIELRQHKHLRGGELGMQGKTIN
jgi:hypothetical protein